MGSRRLVFSDGGRRGKRTGSVDAASAGSTLVVGVFVDGVAHFSHKQRVVLPMPTLTLLMPCCRITPRDSVCCLLFALA